MLVLRALAGRVSVEPESFEEVMEKGLGDLDRALAIKHPVVEFDCPALALRQPGMRSDHHGYRLRPGPIALRIDRVRFGLANIENAGKDEILENFVLVAIGACVPAEAVEPERMRRNPAPLRLRLRHRLIVDAERVTLTNRVKDSFEGSRIDRPTGRRHDPESWGLSEPSLLPPYRPIGDRVQLGKIATRVLYVEDRPKAGCRQVTSKARIVRLDGAISW